MYPQFCVFHGVSLVLVLVGCVAMLSDAFGTRQEWIHQGQQPIHPSNDLKREADDTFDERLAFPARRPFHVQLWVANFFVRGAVIPES